LRAVNLLVVGYHALYVAEVNHRPDGHEDLSRVRSSWRIGTTRVTKSA
jgi:hypothetical protein